MEAQLETLEFIFAACEAASQPKEILAAQGITARDFNLSDVTYHFMNRLAGQRFFLPGPTWASFLCNSGILRGVRGRAARPDFVCCLSWKGNAMYMPTMGAVLQALVLVTVPYPNTPLVSMPTSCGSHLGFS